MAEMTDEVEALKGRLAEREAALAELEANWRRWQADREPSDAPLAAREAQVGEREAAVTQREHRLEQAERGLVDRSVRLDAWGAAQGEAVEPAWELAALPVLNQIRGVMIDTGDDVATVARGLGLDPDWTTKLLAGEVETVDLDHVAQVCEGLHTTPYALWGIEAGRSVAHAYGPELWPSDVEPLPVFESGADRDVPGRDGWDLDDMGPDAAAELGLDLE